MRRHDFFWRVFLLWILWAPIASAADFTPPSPTYFGVSVETGDLRQVKAWLDRGLSPDYQADRLGSGLMIAAWEGNLPMLELFYRYGANVNLENGAGEQALLLAAWRNQRAAIDWLLARGAALNRPSGQWSALHYAAFSGHADLVGDLLARGADIDARNPGGATPLMMAIYDGKQEVARLLIERGADLEARNDRGDGAMEWAMRYNQLAIARRLGDPKTFAAAANQPKESWGRDARSEAAPADLDMLLKARRHLIAKGLSAADIDRNIAALRARYARQERDEAPPSRGAATLEITARRNAPQTQKARLIQEDRQSGGKDR
ncbi:MAG: ankyrin repeat domain-containing protein [Zoogloeaceae bacterium]|jgi:ankyrin repeat protein|nr:ankyrin repeat domain-containing protein [Zoogloeaceae bacterium]